MLLKPVYGEKKISPFNSGNSKEGLNPYLSEEPEETEEPRKRFDSFNETNSPKASKGKYGPLIESIQNAKSFQTPFELCKYFLKYFIIIFLKFIYFRYQYCACE